ncbi:MAG: M23 family metallopeptidase, partial [bacterium]
ISVYQGKPRGWHRGTDFAAPVGTPVYAANHGIVRLAELLPVSGNAVFIDHGIGIITSYLHLSAIHVRAGQPVQKGDRIGGVGSTGLATGPHLHWALRTNGTLVDPLHWVEAPR